MKRLLGGIFARSPSAESPRAAATPPAVDAETSASSSKRWGAFLMPSVAPTQPATTADQEMLRRVDVVLRGVAAHVKAAIGKLLDGEELDEELHKLQEFVGQAVERLQQQSCEPSLELLKSYFSSSMGVALCEQTAFPSLVLDFVAKMRVFAMKEELGSMVKSGDAGMESRRDKRVDLSFEPCESVPDVTVTTAEKETGMFDGLVPSLEVLMNCVVAMASNGTLMEIYRCELPNLIALTAEEYPPAANFIRDGCSRALIQSD
ncbi:hypothetical protein PF008_g3769 [Phytophthora fragariae]|uniref:Uncharacterized protein n=1 Tax=Phytophthora fragariae TaxID=53985 RepID=A0A6G0SD92_9STRA|nr:hypothetical protein PF008_g3769 [Phytophthora fragariae]